VPRLGIAVEGSSVMADRWEEMLKLQNNGYTDKSFLDANAAVGDAVFMAWLYWDAKYPEIKVLPADLIEMARAIVEHQRWLADREAGPA
jgi:hypothetical protein